MNVTLYTDLNKFVDDLAKLSVIDKEGTEVFLEESKKEKIITVFSDTEKGEFECHIWFKNTRTIKEYEIIESIVDSWAYYCGIDDADVLTNLRTCSAVSYFIVKGLKDASG